MKKTAIILLHIGYWVLYLILVSFFIQIMPWNNSHKPSLIRVLFFSQVSTFSFLPGMIGFYSFYLILFRKFLNRKKMAALFFYGIIVSLFSALFTMFILSILFNAKWYMMETGQITGMIIFLSLLALVHGIIGLVMKGFISWFGDIKLKEELNKKNYEMELALVKSQINPHFLFNTINNIDVLIEVDAKKASAYLNKLSAIMRFMLYETKTEQIFISKELSYIEKYIELQKIRTTNLHYVNYAVEGNPENLMIAPMLFIPFIENAFKHAENKKMDNAISIKFVIEKDKIIFECENKYAENSNADNTDAGGLGNELIRKRLMLLYPGKHELKVTTENETYKAKLTLINSAN
jgi:two-component system, LytTR family, sensor kinase